MNRTLLSLVSGIFLVNLSSAVLSLKIDSPYDHSLALAPNESAKVYGTITGVDGDLSSWSFTADGGNGAPVGAIFVAADDGTMGTMGYYMTQNTTADFSGLLGTIFATGASGLSYTNVLTVFDPVAGQSDGENLQVRLTVVQPAPEPSASAALALGGLAVVRRRRLSLR